MEEIGRAIRSARKRKGLNQSQLAKSMDVTQTAITHWENGVHTPTLQKVVDLANALDTSFAQLTSSLSSNEMVATYELSAKKGSNRPEINPIKPRKVNTAASFAFAVRLVLVSGLTNAHHLVNGWAMVFENQSSFPEVKVKKKSLCLMEWENGELTFGRLLPGVDGSYPCWDRVNDEYCEPRELRGCYRAMAYVQINE